jgi:hypothetical protein
MSDHVEYEKNIWSWAPDGARHQDRLTDCQSQCDSDSLGEERRVRFQEAQMYADGFEFR